MLRPPDQVPLPAARTFGGSRRGRAGTAPTSRPRKSGAHRRCGTAELAGMRASARWSPASSKLAPSCRSVLKAYLWKKPKGRSATASTCSGNTSAKARTGFSRRPARRRCRAQQVSRAPSRVSLLAGTALRKLGEFRIGQERRRILPADASGTARRNPRPRAGNSRHCGNSRARLPARSSRLIATVVLPCSLPIGSAAACRA